jgi:programmed cell death 8 (apoptosis-inducing factor)
MAGRVFCSRLQAVTRHLARRPAPQPRRYQSGGGGAGAAKTWLLAAAAGASVVAAYQVYTSNRTKPLVEQKKEAYAKSGAVHPEAVAEQQLTPSSTEAATEESAPPETEAPPPPISLPDKVPYVLVGGGTASFAAAKAIRERDPAAKVLIVTQEKYSPYSRPPLSKHLWLSGDHAAARQLKFIAPWSGGKLVDLFYNADFCEVGELMDREEGGIAVLTGTMVVGMDTRNGSISLAGGHVISYDKCLLATGGRPKTLPIFRREKVEKHVSVYREIPDFLTLDQRLENTKRVLVVGGGFLGTELAVGMATRYRDGGLQVYQLFPESANLGLVLPPALATWTLDRVKKEGVEVFPNVTPVSVEPESGGVKVTTSSGIELTVDHVVVAVGLRPNTDLASSGQLEVDPHLGGFRVNAELQACSNVWAAGDVACFYDPHLGRRRVEHHDHAQVSGRLAGSNMAGDKQKFEHQSMFWSDVGPDVGFEATGVVDSSLPTCGVYPKTSTEVKRKRKPL